MTNIKKIGLTALAASLVSTSAYAGALSVSGGASIGIDHETGAGLNNRPAYTMGNSITFTGSGELENGLTVSLSFEADQGAADGASSPFDNHSITLSSASMGTLKFNGHGGDTASGRVGSTVSGDINDDYTTGAGASLVDIAESGVDNNNFMYTLPEAVAGITAFLSVNPGGATSSNETEIGYGAIFSGVEGLTLGYADTNIKAKNTANLTGDHKVYNASYAFGPITVKYGNSTYEVGTGTAATSTDQGQTVTSMAASYTLSENLSLTVGTETLESGSTASVKDASYSEVAGAYTSGGMTISAALSEAKASDYSAASKANAKQWTLGASFAF